ncbi:hypothetical protein J3F84DRAFT_380116 [Trichoderma pleuroticola]
MAGWLLRSPCNTTKHSTAADKPKKSHVFPCLVSGLTLQPKRTAEPITPSPPNRPTRHEQTPSRAGHFCMPISTPGGQTGNDPCAIARGSPGEPGELGSRPCRPFFLALLCLLVCSPAREKRLAVGDDDGDTFLAHTATAGQVSSRLLRASFVAAAVRGSSAQLSLRSSRRYC